jgi:hypothetical protein
MNRLALFGLVVLLTFPSWLLAVENAGIVDGIWLSTPQPVENQPTRIYVAIHNTTAGDLEGTVHFRVNDQLLDTMRINALSGRIIESWADWVPQAGTSTVSVNLRRTELASNASGTQEVAVVQPLTERTFFIDSDTDGDGVGNQVDEDDDNDGVQDEDERAAGTDPLVYDEPPTPEPVATTEDQENTVRDQDDTTEQVAARDRAGLESMVDTPAASNLLARSTNLITESKQALDSYRTARADSARTTSSDEQATTTETEEAVATTGSVFNSLYTALLATLSWLLGYPWLVQLLFLALLLYTLYRTARYYGRRPS